MNDRKRRRRPRRLWIVIVAAVLVLGGWWLVEAMSGDENAEWLDARRDDLRIEVEVNGTLRAVETSMVGPPQLREFWEFKVSHMAPEGEEVTVGTPVLGFDTTELNQRLLRQQAEADGAIKQIDKTEKNLTMQRRQDDLRLAEVKARRDKARLIVDRPGDLGSAQDLAQSRLDLVLAEKELAYLEQRLEASSRSAEAQLAALNDQRGRAQTEVAKIQSGIAQMTRTAPRDGTVIYVADWNGDKKQVGSSCWKGEAVIELPNLEKMKGEGEVDEADAGKIVEGQQVTLRLDAHPDVRYAGHVAAIGKTVQRKSWRSPLKVVRLEIELDETDTRRMRPGMRFRGEVETERITDALLVPLEAVFPTLDGPVVYRRTMFGVDEVPVELGRRNKKFVEVLSGIGEGDEVSTVEPS